jgi:hypothetical protein
VAGNRLRIYDGQVPNPSGTDKFRAVSRVVGRQAGQSRWTRATYRGLSSFLGSASQAFRALWHQITGFFFFVFGALIALRAVREYRLYAAGQVGPRNSILAAVLALMFLYFAVSSFRSAKKRQ